MEEDKEMLKLLHDIEGGRIGVEEVDEETATRFLQFMKEHIKNKMDDIKKINKEIDEVEEETEKINAETAEINKETRKIEEENEKVESQLVEMEKITKEFQDKIQNITGSSN